MLTKVRIKKVETEWALTALDGLVNDSMLRTTVLHNERLIDRCRMVEAYRILAEDLGASTTMLAKNRRRMADKINEHLRKDIAAVIQRTQYKEQLVRTLKTDGWKSRLRQHNKFKSAQHITALLEMTRDMITAAAARTQGLIGEKFPAREVQELSRQDSTRQADGADGFICSMRKAQDKVTENEPLGVYAHNAVYQIRYGSKDHEPDAPGFTQETSGEERFQGFDRPLVASIQDLEGAICVLKHNSETSKAPEQYDEGTSSVTIGSFNFIASKHNRRSQDKTECERRQ